MPALLDEAKKLLLLGDLASARKTYHKILKSDPANIEALHGTSLAYFQEKNYAEAIRYLLRAVKRSEQNPELHYSLGIVYQHAHEWENAAGAFLRAKQGYERQPGYENKWVNACLRLAGFYIRQGRLVEAKQQIRQILKTDPKHIEALKMQAQIEVGQLRYHLALETLGKLPFEPAVLEALKTEVFLLKQDYRNALRCANRFRELKPEDPHAYSLLGECYLKCQQLDKAIDTFKKGLTLDPCHFRMLSRLLALYVRSCDWEERTGVANRLRSLAAADTSGESLAEIQPTIAILTGFTNQEIQNIVQARSKRIQKEAEPVRALVNFGHKRKEKRKLKIGYLSSDFYNHATAHLMLDVFGLHNRKRFEIFAYSYGRNDKSPYRKKIEADSDHFVEIGKMTDRKAAEKIYDDGIDLLVDLKGHIVDNRLGILALRPSPVQVHYLGYPGTIGAPFVDYLIADDFVIPRSERKYYSESIVAMPISYQVNMAFKTVRKQIPNKKEYGIPADAFVFCCFNQNDKLDTETVTSWMQIMRSIPHSVLWLWGNYEGLKGKIEAFGNKHAIKSERFIVSPTEPSPKHLARMTLADLFLDTFLYSAHTSCSDAIRMGLPVLTRPGRTFASRVAASLLKQVKCASLIAKSTDDYIAKAVGFANTPKTLERVRKILKNNREASRLYDSSLFTKHLEAAYEKMWERYAAGKPPADIKRGEFSL